MFTHRNMTGNSFEFLYQWRFKSWEHHLYMGISHCHVRLPEGIGCPPRHGPIISKNSGPRQPQAAVELILPTCLENLLVKNCEHLKSDSSWIVHGSCWFTQFTPHFAENNT